MSDSFLDWFLLSPEQRADKEIRADLAAGQAAMMHQSRLNRDDTERLRTQLRQRTESLEERLDRLAESFTSYVELTEVRDRLSILHAQSVEQRRLAMAALTRLAAGERCDPLASDPDYWLPDAVNAVAAIVDRRRDVAAEARARALEPRADQFLLIAAAALDRAALVAERLPEVLVNDGTLSPTQYLLWRSALAGDFGSVVASLGDVVKPALLGSSGWATWASSEAERSFMTPIAWLERLTRPLASAGETVSDAAAEYIEREAGRAPERHADLPPARSETQKALTVAMLELVREGKPDERELTTRERELLSRLGGDRPDHEAEPHDLLTEVRRALLDESLDPAVRRVVLTWCAPHLTQALAGNLVADPSPTTVVVFVAGRRIPVTSTGYDQAQLQSALTATEDVVAQSRRRLWTWSIGALALVILGGALWTAGNQVGIFALLLSVPTAAVVWTRWTAWLSSRADASATRTASQQAVHQATSQAVTGDAQGAEERARRLAIEDLVRVRLNATEAAS